MRLLSLLSIASFAGVAASFFVGQLSGAAAETSATARTVSGPFVHENLAVYFVHGPSAPGPVPLTLAEALEKGTARVHETGNVNALEFENLGREEIFIQTGDIVKGGKQDRVLTVSLVVPPRSGRVSIAAYCVEQGRWAVRGVEDVATFSSSAAHMPSRRAKLAMNRPDAVAADAARPNVAGSDGIATSAVPSYTDRGRRDIERQQAVGRSPAPSRQSEVWAEVASTQAKLASGLAVGSVAAAASGSSLQLTLENEKLAEVRKAYLDAIGVRAKDTSDVVGLVFAVNGKINSADVYPSNGLFQKMRSKLLEASVTEAIGERVPAGDGATAPATAPDAAAVLAFLDAAEKPTAAEQPVGKLMTRAVRDADAALSVEARRAEGTFVHRTYLAK